MSVNVVSGEALQQRHIVSLQDIAAAIPGSSYTTTSFNTPVFTIRGIGFYDNSIASYPSVSLYLDEIPLAFPVLSRHSAYDLDRVEVLKGPQGTLFGQNATGGAINFVAAKPTNEFHSGFEVTYGRFNATTLQGFVSGPLSDTVRARFSGQADRADGWQYSISQPGEKNGQVLDYMGRLVIDIEPVNQLRIMLNFNAWQDKSQPQAPQYIASFPQVGVLDPGVAAAKFTPDNSRAADWSPGLQHSDNRFWQSSARVDFDVNDDMTLTSLTAYTEYHQEQAEDQDGIVPSDTDITSDTGSIQSFFQELRIANSGKDPVRWVLGANLEHTKTMQEIAADFQNSGTHVLFASDGLPDFNGNTYSNPERLKNYAGFGNVEGDIGQFTLKGGVRYTASRQSADICNSDKYTDGLGALVFGSILGGAFGPYVPGTCFVINNTGAPVGGVAAGAPGAFKGDLDQNNVSWRVGLDYKPVEHELLYANVAKGFKAGGFPTLAAATFKQLLPVTQESVMSYEVGSKSLLFDRSLEVNAAAFYYDYTDKQIRAKLDDPIFGVLDALQNIPKSKIKGFEIESSWRALPGLTIAPQFTFLDATVSQFVGIGGSGADENFAGTPLPYTPRYQMTLNVDYEKDIGRDLKTLLGATGNYRSATISVIGGETNPVGATPQNLTLFQIDPYATLDLRAGVGTVDNRWTVQIFGKNVLNKYCWNNVSTVTDTIVRYSGMPATFGVSLAYRN